MFGRISSKDYRIRVQIVCSRRSQFLIQNTILNQFLMSDAKLSNNKSRKTLPNSKNTVDVAMFVSEDDITDVVIYKHVVKEYSLVARSNNQIQVVDQQKYICSYKAPGAPLCISCFDEEKAEYLVGLSTGTVICLSIESKSNNFSLKEIWKIDSNDKKVTSISKFPKGLIMCRSNEFQIWVSEQSQYERTWKKSLAESATNFKYLIQTDQILFTSMNGAIIALSNYEKQIKQNRFKAQEAKTGNIKIQKEIEILNQEKSKLMERREIIPKYKLKHTLLLNQIKRCWVLDLSCSIPMNNIVFDGINGVQAQYKSEFKSDVNAERESQVFSVNDLKQLQFNIYSEEGIEKTGHIFISFTCQPPQATMIPIELKPLNLYTKISNTISNNIVSDWHKLTITGAFALSQMNVWLLSIFNETVKQLPQTELRIVYQSILTKENIAVIASAKRIQIFSQSVNPLVVIKKHIQAKAKEKEISITIDVAPSQIALTQSLKKLQPQFLKFQKLHKQHKILPQLLQLSKQVQDLNSSFKQIIRRKDDIEKEYSSTLGVYQTLKDSLFKMFINYKGLKNESVTDFQTQNFRKKLGSFQASEIKRLIL